MGDSQINKAAVPEITVIVTTFNQPFSAVANTLSSILLQEKCDIEIVIADDCSEHDETGLYQEFLDEVGFANYQIVRAPENVKTVRNILNAAKLAHAPLIKPMGVGDLLYSSTTLRNIVDFMNETSADIGFGNIAAFVESPEGFRAQRYNAPKNKEPYRQEGEYPAAQTVELVLRTSDWIPGCVQFYKKETLITYMELLSASYNVCYCEDLAFVLALCDGRKVAYLDEYVLWYELGTGISTDPSKGHVRHMYDDHRHFLEGIARMQPFGTKYPLVQNVYRIKRFLALRTPFYPYLQRIAMQSYMGNTSNDMEFNAFFWQCYR